MIHPPPEPHIVLFWIAAVTVLCAFILAGALINRYWLHRNVKTFRTSHSAVTDHSITSDIR